MKELVPTAEIFCLGNELLIGRTVNKNATDISLVLSRLGYTVNRITTVRDDLDQAVQAFQELLKRKPTVICVSGGLGPTFDDIQLMVIAKALDTRLELNEQARLMIAARYRVPPEELSQAGIKMAMLPPEGTPLNNSVGTAPGVKIPYEYGSIYCLPGIPKEMQAILDEQVLPYLKQHSEAVMYEFGFTLRGVGESRIVDVTSEVMKQYPEVQFKSHPRKDETGYWLSLQTYQIGNSPDYVKDACIAWQEALLKVFNVEVSEVNPVFDASFIPE
ncbi:MAG: molybdopterin-binding protein [Candidatus Kariarchaeaceae archaeon]